MKKDYLITLMLLCFHSSLVFGTVFRVNNQFESDQSQKLYSSIQEAHDAAMDGDTLMIEGSTTAYSDAAFAKRLVVIGTGYFLTENTPSQANVLNSVVRYIYLKNGSEGTVLMGLEFLVGGGFDIPTPTIEVNDIIIMRCNLRNGLSLLGKVRNIKILQNYIHGGGISTNRVGTIRDEFSDVELSNNIIYSINISSTTQWPRVFSKVEHNVFVSSVNITASVIRSNIFMMRESSTTLNSSTIQNNLFKHEKFKGAGNITYLHERLFSEPESLYLLMDNKYQIKSDSPYKTAGFGNTEPGIFGGKTPYALSGLPPSPTLYEFSADSFGTKEGGLSIQLKAKSNL